MGQTMVEKLFSKKNKLGTPVMAGDIVEARIDGMMHNYSFHTVIEQAIKAGFTDGLCDVFATPKDGSQRIGGNALCRQRCRRENRDLAHLASGTCVACAAATTAATTDEW